MMHFYLRSKYDFCLFCYDCEKQKVICFMTRENYDYTISVINLMG